MLPDTVVGTLVAAPSQQREMLVPAEHEAEVVELSVVMPCLDEADTLATCITKAKNALERYGISGEIIVADNGSRDGSREIAARLGARVVPVAARGYGNALMGGIAAARGEYVLMGDADDSYDFGVLPHFLDQLRAGNDLVQGCRLPAGGGTVLEGAMPWSHRWVGNPLFSRLVRLLFRAPLNDVYCGMRAFRKRFYESLDLRCTGMEFAIEMLVKASLHGGRLAEVPITLYPDGRIAHPPHLRTCRDGWRTLRFLMLSSPRWLFLLPGLLLLWLGTLGYAVALPGLSIAGLTFDAHTLLVASLAVLLGFQSILFALFTNTFAVSEGLLPPDPFLANSLRRTNLERGLFAGLVSCVFGLGLLVFAVSRWRSAGYGVLDYAITMREVIPGVTFTALGFQTMLASCFLSILRMARK